PWRQQKGWRSQDRRTEPRRPQKGLRSRDRRTEPSRQQKDWRSRDPRTEPHEEAPSKLRDCEILGSYTSSIDDRRQRIKLFFQLRQGDLRVLDSNTPRWSSA